MRAVHVGDLESALAAIDAGHAELTRERAQLATVREALAGWPATPDGPRSPLRIGEAARAVGVRPPVLRLWESRGLLRPVREPGTGYRLYDRAELRTAHIVALLRRGHQPLAAIGTVLEALCSTGSPDDVLGELAARERELHDRSLGRLRASAALHAYLTVAGGMVVVAGSGAGAS
ncbi:hypothetical protein GCM10020221_25200 [Streptomyces thioluteus]|uniref:HTH merR-type domain-containing protein n=1 Tax=Streptomyces thioluteus TaxID=66431 RepID=A0ABN3WUB5_STRTU